MKRQLLQWGACVFSVICREVWGKTSIKTKESPTSQISITAVSNWLQLLICFSSCWPSSWAFFLCLPSAFPAHCPRLVSLFPDEVLFLLSSWIPWEGDAKEKISLPLVLLMSGILADRRDSRGNESLSVQTKGIWQSWNSCLVAMPLSWFTSQFCFCSGPPQELKELTMALWSNESVHNAHNTVKSFVGLGLFFLWFTDGRTEKETTASRYFCFPNSPSVKCVGSIYHSSWVSVETDLLMFAHFDFFLFVFLD